LYIESKTRKTHNVHTPPAGYRDPVGIPMEVRQWNYGVNQPLPLFTYKYFFKKSRPTIELLKKQRVIFFKKWKAKFQNPDHQAAFIMVTIQKIFQKLKMKFPKSRPEKKP
jgi:hypothetical protein